MKKSYILGIITALLVGGGIGFTVCADTPVEIKSQGRIESGDIIYDANDFNALLSAMEDGKVESYNRGKTEGYAEGYEAGGISTPSFTIDGALLCNKYCYFGGSGDFYGATFNSSAGEPARETGYRYQFTKNTLSTYRYFLIQISGGQRSIPSGGQELFTDVFYYDAKRIPVNTTIQTCQSYYPTIRVYGIR